MRTFSNKSNIYNYKTILENVKKNDAITESSVRCLNETL